MRSSENGTPAIDTATPAGLAGTGLYNFGQRPCTLCVNAAVQSGQATFTCPNLGLLLGVSSQEAGVLILPLAGQWIVR